MPSGPAAAPARSRSTRPAVARPATSRGARGLSMGMALGAGIDALVADPRRGHPVAAFGVVAAGVESATYRDSRAAGVAYAGLLTGGAGLLGALAATAAARPVPRLAVTAAATWLSLGGTTLRREAAAMDRLLRAYDLPAARRRVGHLCGRDAADLGVEALARATVESVAENTSDAVVAPLLWGALLGVPGLLAYRAVNTLDAMVGHRSPRHERFGWASARADDLANLLPARLTAALVVALAPVVGGRPRRALRVWRRDGRKHPSPNAGPVEAAFAGALGRTLGGRLAYGGRVEDRPLLGDGPAPGVADVRRVARLSLAVSVAATCLAVGVRALLDRLVAGPAR